MKEKLIQEAKSAIESESDLDKTKNVLDKLLTAYTKTVKRLDKIVTISDKQQNMLQLINERSREEQRMAHAKQMAMNTNDLLNDENIDLKIVYVAADILSGDAYSIHRLKNGDIFIYLTDAMGHGLLPSLTSFALASFIKQAALQVESLDEMLKMLSLPFETLLADDEQLSGSLFWIDKEFKTLSYAMAGMYPAVFEDKNGHTLLKSNNVPAMNFMPNWSAKSYELDGFKSLVLYTDGLVEGDLFEYDEDHMHKLLDKNLLDEIEKRAKTKAPEDDLTVIYFGKRPS